MGLFQNLAVAALCTGAYLSNPDERTFQFFIEDEIKREGSTWLERKVVSHVAAKSYKRDNYYLFSLIRVPEDRLTFFGVFGRWFHVPIELPAPPTAPKSN